MKVSQVLAFSIASLSVAITAHSAPVSWTGGDGLWNSSSNWGGGLIPGAGDEVTLGVPGISVVYFNSANPALKSLTVDAVGGTSLLQPANAITAETVIIGNTQRGSYIQNGGTLTVTGNTPQQHLIIGAGNGGSGSYTITNGSIL